MSQSTLTVFHPVVVPRTLSVSMYNLVPASPGTVAPSAAYKPTSKYPSVVPASRHHPIFVILAAPDGLVSLKTKALSSTSEN